MADTFCTCRRCSSDACYEVDHGNSMHWQCMDCGFYTNTTMLKNSEVVENIKATSPDLYKDLLFEDADGLVWAPKILNGENGTIFIDGTSVDNWSWAFVPQVVIPEAERYRYPKKGFPGEYHTTKSDLTKKKNYGQLDFVLALQDSGMFLNATT